MESDCEIGRVNRDKEKAHSDVNGGAYRNRRRKSVKRKRRKREADKRVEGKGRAGGKRERVGEREREGESRAGLCET